MQIRIEIDGVCKTSYQFIGKIFEKMKVVYNSNLIPYYRHNHRLIVLSRLHLVQWIPEITMAVMWEDRHQFSEYTEATKGLKVHQPFNYIWQSITSQNPIWSLTFEINERIKNDSTVNVSWVSLFLCKTSSFLCVC